METKNTNGAHTLNGAAKDSSKVAEKGAIVKGSIPNPKKENVNGNNEAEKPHPVQLKDEKPEIHQPGEQLQEEQKPAAVQLKEELLPAKPVLNLENRLKVVDDLHRKSTQRLNLIKRKGQLEAFEVALAQENDELEDNPYQGCKLIIRDDKNREFVTTTPGLIRLVSQFIFNACHEKLADIEASIVFPNA